MVDTADLSTAGHCEAPGRDTGPGNPLHRGLGVPQIVFMVVAAAAPLGLVAGGVPIAFAVSGSPGMPLFFALTTVMLLIFAVGFTLMAGRVRNAGAFYACVQAGLGRIPGLWAATLALFSYTLILVGVTPTSASRPLLVCTTEGAWVIGGFVALSAVAGVVQALVLRTCRPAVYRRLDEGTGHE